MPTRAEQKAATRARLLDAAAVLVASKGVEGATVDAIAAEAGVTTGALYASFRTKAQLLADLVAERNADASGIPVAALAEDAGERWSALLDSSPVDAALLRELLVAAGRDATLRAVMSAAVGGSVRALSARLEDEALPLRLPAHEVALLLQVLAAGTAVLRELVDLPPSLMTSAVGLLRADA